jgi:acetyl-CoA carboxylase carboxyltransferase component
VDQVIDSRDTRRALIEAFAMLRDKSMPSVPRKHGNLPV